MHVNLAAGANAPVSLAIDPRLLAPRSFDQNRSFPG
jgi:hypothetical protein